MYNHSYLCCTKGCTECYKVPQEQINKYNILEPYPYLFADLMDRIILQEGENNGNIFK